jgi:CHAD domain-containing protein
MPAWKPPRLKAKMSVAKALSASVATCMNQIIAARVVLRRQDSIEGVHRMRVGVRRLRVALSSFRRALAANRKPRFDSDLRWLPAATTRIRSPPIR